MKFCPECEIDYSSDDDFCAECGKPLQGQNASQSEHDLARTDETVQQSEPLVTNLKTKNSAALTAVLILAGIGLVIFLISQVDERGQAHFPAEDYVTFEVAEEYPAFNEDEGNNDGIEVDADLFCDEPIYHVEVLDPLDAEREAEEKRLALQGRPVLENSPERYSLSAIRHYRAYAGFSDAPNQVTSVKSATFDELGHGVAVYLLAPFNRDARYRDGLERFIEEGGLFCGEEWFVLARYFIQDGTNSIFRTCWIEEE